MHSNECFPIWNYQGWHGCCPGRLAASSDCPETLQIQRVPVSSLTLRALPGVSLPLDNDLLFLDMHIWPPSLKCKGHKGSRCWTPWRGGTRDEGKGEEPMNATMKVYESVSHLESAEQEPLLLEQLPQVRYIARRIHNRLPSHIQLDDLVQAGILGLIGALHKYDPSKNVELKTYAKYRIQGAILDSLRDLDWSPRPLRKKARQLEEAHQRLRARLGRPATEPELADELGVELKDLQRLLSDLRGLDLGSLQDEFTESGQERESLAAKPEGTDQEPFSNCLQGELRELLARAVGELQPRERQVLSLYYFEELTMKEVGAVLGVGEARVSQIHSAASVRLRARMRDLLEKSPPRLEGPPPNHPNSMETSWRRF
jgi:RNA polymerase sigma factor for flagellar operon FliA